MASKLLKSGGIAIIISLFIGIAVFIYFFFRLGPRALILISQNFDYRYIFLFFVFSFLGFVFATLRARIILQAYGKKVNFFLLLKQIISGYAVSYITPSARFGGEPVRIYMLKKEAGVDYKIGTASVLMDKFVEILGVMLFGLIGVIMFVFAPKLAFNTKIFVATGILVILMILSVFYWRCISGKGSISSLFKLFLLHKIPRLSKFIRFIKDVEKKMSHFFIEHKKAFIKSILVYAVYLIFTIIQMKFLLLGLGTNVSVIVLIVSLTFLGIAEVIPVPAALGFLEAGQSAVFSLFAKGGSLGFAVSVFLRISAIIFVALGFVFLSHFGWKTIGKMLQKVFNISEKEME